MGGNIIAMDQNRNCDNCNYVIKNDADGIERYYLCSEIRHMNYAITPDEELSIDSRPKPEASVTIDAPEGIHSFMMDAILCVKKTFCCNLHKFASEVQEIKT